MSTRFLAGLLMISVCSTAFAQDKKEEWIPLFNGKNLDGWTPKIKGYDLGVNHNDTFRVRTVC